MLKVVCVSDTHELHAQLDLTIYPDCDILLHAGDFSGTGTKTETIKFFEWFNRQPFKHKIFINGNHDWLGERDPEAFANLVANYPDITHLQGTGIVVEGIKIQGFADTPEFCNWAFNRTQEELTEIWKGIDEDTDVLLCHGPPHYILDEVNNNWSATCNVGDPALALAVSKLDLKACVFGHIHTQGGKQVEIDGTLFVNAAVLNDGYQLAYEPQLIEV